MTDPDGTRLLREQRCRLAGLHSSLLFVIGLVGLFTGWNFLTLGTGRIGWYLVGLGVVITIVGGAGVGSLYGYAWPQWLVGRLAGDSDAVWNEPWYDDVSPYSSLSVRDSVVDANGGEEA